MSQKLGVKESRIVTMALDPELHKEVRVRAAEADLTVPKWIEGGIRERLAARPQEASQDGWAESGAGGS